jgi:hypothetical protein
MFVCVHVLICVNFNSVGHQSSNTQHMVIYVDCLF